MTNKTRVLFLTTNYCWGASEFLWYETIKQMHTKGYNVFAYVYKYSHSAIDELKEELGSERVFNEKKMPPLRFYKRWLNKIYPLFKQNDTLIEVLTSFKPHLVVISKGNAFGDEEIPLIIKQLGFNYIIVNHLVTESSWPSITEDSRRRLLEGICFSNKNYFVSQLNSILFQKMVGTSISNCDIIYNPLLNLSENNFFYPDTKNGYHVAIVGRLECFHKGLDLFIEVVKQQKWKERSIYFNIYGEGPHKEIIRDWIKDYRLKNIILHGYILDKREIWSNNHILLLPSRMEGQSISLSEAIYAKRSVIGTNVGGIAEYINDQKTGFLAKEANFADLDDAMERAWEKRGEWKILGEIANKTWEVKVPANPVEYFMNQITTIIK